MPRVRSMLLQDPDGEGVSEMVVMVNKVSYGKGERYCVTKLGSQLLMHPYRSHLI